MCDRETLLAMVFLQVVEGLSPQPGREDAGESGMCGARAASSPTFRCLTTSDEKLGGGEGGGWGGGGGGGLGMRP